MKTTKTRVTRLPSGTYVAEICDAETGEALITSLGKTDEAARADARANWKRTVQQLST